MDAKDQNGFTELNTYLTTPADFLASFDAYMFQIVPDYREQITIVHEVSKVLDFDGQSCESRIIRDHGSSHLDLKCSAKPKYKLRRIC